MFLWSIQITVVSIILIFLVHYLINYFKSTLTVPKIKDLVNTSTQKYDDMYNIITQQKTDDDLGYTEIDLLPKPNVESMKNELKNFFRILNLFTFYIISSLLSRPNLIYYLIIFYFLRLVLCHPLIKKILWFVKS